jgi:hypothetical protein
MQNRRRATMQRWGHIGASTASTYSVQGVVATCPTRAHGQPALMATVNDQR